MFSEKPINYHLRKTEECDKLGIQLIHIFEDEWNYKKKIVKSILKTTLNKNRYKIQFDNCNIKLIDINLKDKFLNKYHIDGTCESDLNFGLFLRNKLIALFACKKINNNYEIFRYAIIFNFTIINCFDSFLKYFSEKYNPNLVYFTIDRRWNNTKQFNSLDFIVEKIIMPQYTYVKNNHRYNINEYQEIDNNKKYIIYDCGKIKLVKQFKK